MLKLYFNGNRQNTFFIITVWRVNFEGGIFVDWIVKTFRGYIFEDYN